MTSNCFSSPDRPLRIGFFTDAYAPQVSGVTVTVQLLAGELRAAGHHVTIFAPRYPGHRDSEPDIYRLPSVCYLRQPLVYMGLPATPRTVLALRRHRFDVVHSHSPLSVGMLAYLIAHAKHVPLVYTYHTSITDYTHYIKVGGRTRPVRRAAQWFSKTTTNFGDYVTVPSAKVKQTLQAQNVRRPIYTIPNGIDLNNFYRARSTGLYRRRLGLDSEAPLLLYVGRVDPEKHIDFLIEAFPRIAARHPDAHLVIAGDGGARAGLETQAAATGYGNRIHFLGMLNRAEVPELLHEATVFLSASTTETQCLSMLEAIAAGLPVVAVQDSAFEGMLVDGLNGRGVPGDAEALADAVSELLADPAQRRSYSHASVQLSQKYSVEGMALAMSELYREAISLN